MTESWDESKPAGSRSPTLGDDDIREFKRAMRERLAEDHDFEAEESPAFGSASSTIGKHKYATLLEQSADKTTLENEVCLINKAVSSQSELHIIPENGGSAKQLTANNASKLHTLGFHNGTYAIEFPTNQPAAAKLMLGDGNTVAWFYLNTAPPFWKVLSTGADSVLGVAGGSQAYNVDGGNQAGTWTQPDHTLTTDEIPAHTHGTSGAHVHTIHDEVGGGGYHGVTDVNNVDDTGYSNFMTSGGAHQHTSVGGGSAHSHGSTYRVAASVGKLFQLDAA